nr:LacI family DNA-binding transcriptional regulator [Opitutaceae bacterium]
PEPTPPPDDLPVGPVTMKDLARALGLSVSAVSLSLSGRTGVAEATRRLVLAKAEEMGYRKNPLVSALMETRRKRVSPDKGTVLAFLSFNANDEELKRSPQPDYFAGCAAEAARLGIRLERFWVMDPSMPPRRLSAILKARGIRGAILGACPIAGYKPDLVWEDFCWTSMTVSIDSPPLDLVNSDHFGNMHTALMHARQLGYRRVALAMNRTPDDRLRRPWLAAYLAHSGDVNPDGPLEPYREDQWTLSSLREWYARTRPDLIIGLARGNRMQLLREAGIDVPRKVGFLSVSVPQHDDTQTGIRENWSALEIEAVRNLSAQIMRNQLGPPNPPRFIRLPGTWNTGTTALPRV